MEEVPFGAEVRRKIEDEFKEVLRLMNFNTKGHDIFRRWYVDGRVYYHKVIDRNNNIRSIESVHIETLERRVIISEGAYGIWSHSGKYLAYSDPGGTGLFILDINNDTTTNFNNRR